MPQAKKGRKVTMKEIARDKVLQVFNVFNRIVLVKCDLGYVLLTFSRPQKNPIREPEQYIALKEKTTLSLFRNKERKMCAVLHKGEYVVQQKTRTDILAQEISEEEAKLWIKWTGVKIVRRHSS